MLTFFRTIRRKLIEREKLRKYLLYAIGEIMLVVIGILIALQVNNWNESRKAEAISDNILESLKVELMEDRSQIQQANAFNKRILNESELYLNNKLDLDSLNISHGRVFLLTNYANVDLEMPVLNRELSSESLIMGQDSLKTKLREIKSYYQMSQGAKDVLVNFWNSKVTSYYVESDAMVEANRYYQNKNFNEQKARDLLKDAEFKNLVALTNVGLYQLVSIYNSMIGLMDEAILIIEEEE
jgi:hypothetical protein